MLWGKKTDKKKNKDQITFNVLMVGARRCGKSSALYAMTEEFTKYIGANKKQIISIMPDRTTETLLRTRFEGKEPGRVFEEKTPDSRWVIDEDPDSAINEYCFQVSVDGAKNDYLLVFKDIPGEFFVRPEKEKELGTLFDDSQIIMVCIDTPHLVEDDGAYSIFNFPSCINTFLGGMGYDQEGKRKGKLVLFAPMKCEKYYYKAQTAIDTFGNKEPKDMKYVSEVVKKTYSVFLARAKSDPAFTVAFTPMLTLGGVVFDDFERNEKGRVKKFKMGDMSIPMSLRGRPETAWYRFYQDAPVYAPKYCEQPVLYILNYILAICEEGKKSEEDKKKKANVDAALKIGKVMATLSFGILGYLTMKLIGSILEDKLFINAVNAVCRDHMKFAGDGYELITDPLGIRQRCN
ncbi:MAG: hypothetical protein LUG93_17510 [Lachnospiraceae bacterium]|nr:hypothetical protein [Lachnospiraceae bacterium]